MHQTRPGAKPRRAGKLAALVLVVLALGAVAVPGAFAGASKTVAGEATAPSLHKTVLTDTKGLTLYALSGEKNGRFYCTGSCTKTWDPLLVPAGTTPKGPVKLGTVKRPEGKIQVTYKGAPLYTFAGDSKKGEASGQGIMDVGTWHAVTP